jgi:hypothetical protein
LSVAIQAWIEALVVVIIIIATQFSCTGRIVALIVQCLTDMVLIGPHWSSTRAINSCINSAGRLFHWVQACNVCFKFWGFGRYLVVCIPVIEM